MPLDIKVSTGPILWNNDDVPELTPFVPHHNVMSEMVKAGFEGTELGTLYPRTPDGLRSALGRHGLRLSGGYFCADFTRPELHAETFERAAALCELLGGAGAEHLIVADSLRPERAAVTGRAKGEDGMRCPAFRAFVDALHGLAQVAHRHRLQMVFHNHVGTYVETPAELDRLLGATDPRVGLCLDTGHCLAGGGDPIAVIRRWGHRLRYVHLKDLHPPALSAAVERGEDFFGCLRRRLFVELGTGVLDLRGVLRALSDLDYRGWVVCEQDTTHRTALESARISRANLSAALASTS